jgi:hypothetical protein
MFRHLIGTGKRGHMEQRSADARATDLELDDALARAIRQLIAEAIEVAEGAADAGAAGSGATQPTA